MSLQGVDKEVGGRTQPTGPHYWPTFSSSLLAKCVWNIHNQGHKAKVCKGKNVRWKLSNVSSKNKWSPLNKWALNMAVLTGVERIDGCFLRLQLWLVENNWRDFCPIVAALPCQQSFAHLHLLSTLMDSLRGGRYTNFLYLYWYFLQRSKYQYISAPHGALIQSDFFP